MPPLAVAVAVGVGVAVLVAAAMGGMRHQVRTTCPTKDCQPGRSITGCNFQLPHYEGVALKKKPPKGQPARNTRPKLCLTHRTQKPLKDSLQKYKE